MVLLGHRVKNATNTLVSSFRGTLSLKFFKAQLIPELLMRLSSAVSRLRQGTMTDLAYYMSRFSGIVPFQKESPTV